MCVAGLSIAHSGNTACALVSECGRPFGVDVEERINVEMAVHNLNPNQCERFHNLGLPDADLSMLLWTAREAVGKALKMGLAVASDALDVNSISAAHDGSYDVRFEKLPMMRCGTLVFDDVVMSLATPLHRRTQLRISEAKINTGGYCGEMRCWKIDSC
ncbi:4'-phosphopantetheinyl transferase family protein [Rothia sp. 11254D007CT]